jgi:hypothetical protein
MRAALLGLTALAAGACAHNDVLVFGTSTTIGLNVETSSGQGAAPSIVLGYEREEAVWMPLAVNGWGARVPSCGWLTCTPVDDADSPESRLYQSIGRDSSGRLRVDTYSVFASLGAKFNGKANTGAEAGGGLAQFFATGGAAIAVAENEALVTALKVESEQGAQAQANAVAAAAGQPTVAQAILADNEAYTALETCTKGADGGWHWDEILSAMPEDAITLDDMLYLSKFAQADLPRLRTNPRLRDATLRAAQSTSLC